MTEPTIPAPDRTAIVLGGGGVAGIAWELGVLSGLAAEGIPVETPDLVVGTSAGSVVGTLLRLGQLDVSYRQQLEPVPTTYEEPVASDPDAIAQRIGEALTGASSEQDARARLGLAAQRVTGGQSGDDRTATFAETFGCADWPALPLAVTAVDATDGSFRVLTAADGVPLARAVAASCSVPFVWSPVTVEGRPFVDGGFRNSTNADVAAGYGRVLVLACGPQQPTPTGPSVEAMVTAMEQAGSRVAVVTADEASLAAFGTNALALSTQAPAATAGRAQAAREAERVRALFA